jgi:carboxypeptidase Taq
MSRDLETLKERLAQLVDLRHMSNLAHWDQQTMMPHRGALARAESLATLERINHEIFVSAETGRLLDGAAAELSGAAYESDDAALVRLTARQWEKARRVPTDLAAELAHASSLGQEAWVAARRDSDFDSFAPYLARNLELARRYVDCLVSTDGFECAYDVLLDDYEPEMRTSAVTKLFAELKSRLVPLIAEVVGHQDEIDAEILHRTVAIDAQRALVAEVVAAMGFEREGWRMDDTVHPFAISVGGGDVRITTRWDESYFPMGLYGAMHECGHGLYEDGIDPALRRSALGRARSLGMHESQSRMWENMVGRGAPYCQVLAQRIPELFGWPMDDVDARGLFRAVNRVSPSLIRVEADEATYSLHVILRFELEQELIEGTLSVADLPEAWNARVKEYLGIEVPDDAHGVLQDVHWAGGLIGYFPTYALGNLIAGALWERARLDLPELDDRLAEGDLVPLRAWLREHVHRHGSKFTTAELLEREAAGPIRVDAFAGYLERKLADAYGLKRPLSDPHR